jgi:hypothetical protein
MEGRPREGGCGLSPRPLLFVIAVAFVLYGAYVLITGRAVWINLSRAIITGIVIISLVALAFNWAAKLVWLGM